MTRSWTPIGSAFVFSAHDGEPVPVGQVAMHENGYAFRYANSWLTRSTSFAVDPLNLPLSERLFSAPKMWGVFQDATPDNWGKKVLLATRSQQPQNEIEWLLATRGTGAGCLLFSGSRTKLPSLNQPPDFDQLEALLSAADQVALGDTNLPPELSKLLDFGSSMGGARPKVTVVRDGVEWIAKLSRRDDIFDQPRAEFASLQLARAAGIRTADHDLVEIRGQAVLLVKRFDRNAGGRSHYLSAFSLVNPHRMRVGDTDGPMSYLRIADVIRKVSEHSASDSAEMYARMAMNVLIGNTDDHMRNHGFLQASPTSYELSPVFDVLPHPGELGLQALVVGAEGRKATIENLLSSPERFGLDRDTAVARIQSIQEVLSRASAFFENAGMKAAEVRSLAQICSRMEGPHR